MQDAAVLAKRAFRHDRDARRDARDGPADRKACPWTSLTDRAHVILCLWRDPRQALRHVAQQVGLTERAVQRIVADPLALAAS